MDYSDLPHEHFHQNAAAYLPTAPELLPSLVQLEPPFVALVSFSAVWVMEELRDQILFARRPYQNQKMFAKKISIKAALQTDCHRMTGMRRFARRILVLLL